MGQPDYEGGAILRFDVYLFTFFTVWNFKNGFFLDEFLELYNLDEKKIMEMWNILNFVLLTLHYMYKSVDNVAQLVLSVNWSTQRS